MARAAQTTIQTIEGGTVTTPKGYVAGATYAGIKTYTQDKLDLGLFMSKSACTLAGMFTTNAVKSGSLIVCQETLTKGKARAFVANSGIANTSVGEQGVKDARETVALAAAHLGLKPDEVLICSTGKIGVELPMALIRSGIKKIKLSEMGGHDLARAILTTDTRTKEVAASFGVRDGTVTVGGIAKGAGMIHPNMATMLAFIATDAQVDKALLQGALKESVDKSFNMISVDGDTSTNDTVLLFANGASGVSIREGTSQASLFKEALDAVCIHLAKEIVRDGEGATRLIAVTVEDAATLDDARKAARTIVSSSLVKTAVHGADPNWGRIVAALGRSGARVEESKLALYVNDVCIVDEGRPIPFHRDAVVSIMQTPEVSFRLRLGLGTAKATAWGCDLTEEYVTFNSAYTT